MPVLTVPVLPVLIVPVPVPVTVQCFQSSEVDSQRMIVDRRSLTVAG